MDADFAFARTCYDHLADQLGVALHDALLANGWLITAGPGYALSPSGRDGLPGLGVDVSALAARRRTLARPCLDWTARRPHLAGALGAAITASLLDRRWIERQGRPRVVGLTPAGQAQLRQLLGPRVTLEVPGPAQA